MIEQILMREAERDASDSNPSWAYADMKQERVKIQLTVYRGEEDA